MASTVPVTSRSAYNFLSAGARPVPAAQITAPQDSSTASISSLLKSARHPEMDSSLSSVPPVCPSPRPDNCGTAAPQADTKGASGSVILSPTPPVECLSAVGRFSPDQFRRSPLFIIACVQREISLGFIPLSKIAISSADICSSATMPRVYASTTQSIIGSLNTLRSRLAAITSTAANGSVVVFIELRAAL